jgi:protein-tyrosine phosphatase
MAHVVLDAKLEHSSLARSVEVDSSGTGDWHVGQGMDARAASTLAAGGYDPTRHRAQQFDAAWFERHDAILAMDSENERDVLQAAPDDEARGRVLKLRDFDPLAGDDRDVPDPWYGGQQGFDDVLAMIERSTDRLLEALNEVLDG